MTRKALIAAIQQFIFNNVWILKCLRRLIDHPTFSKSFETLFKSNWLHAAITGARKRGGIWEGLGAVKMIKDQIQYRSQSLLSLAYGYFTNKIKSMSDCISQGAKLWKQLKIDFCPITLWESCHCIRYKLYQFFSQKTHVEYAKSW